MKEEYIGKKDKNGKKIYIGDFLKGQFDLKYVVVRSFDNGHAFRHAGPVQAIAKYLNTETCEVNK